MLPTEVAAPPFNNNVGIAMFENRLTTDWHFAPHAERLVILMDLEEMT